MKKTGKATVEICAMCGKVAKEEDYRGETFRCSRCGADVSIVMSRDMFLKVAREYGKE